MQTPSHPNDAADTAALAAGLLLPGGGQMLRGELLAGLFVLLGTCFFWLCAALELVVNNMRGYPAPLKLWDELAALKSPLTLVPHVIVAILFAIALHTGAAWFASRNSARTAAEEG